MTPEQSSLYKEHAGSFIETEDEDDDEFVAPSQGQESTLSSSTVNYSSQPFINSQNLEVIKK